MEQKSAPAPTTPNKDVNMDTPNATPAAPAAPTPASMTPAQAAKMPADVPMPGKEPGDILPDADKVKEEPKVEPPKSSKKKYKVKVDQSEQELEFDPSNDEEVVKHLQRSQAADKRFREAAEVRKAAMEFISELKKNPRKVLSDPNIGIDVKKFAEEIINEQIAELEKTPEQREKEKLLKEVEELREKQKKSEEELKTKEMARLQAEQERALTEEISAALDIGGMPKNARTVARMADMMMLALQNGIKLEAKDVAPLVKNNTMSEFKEIIASLSDDQLDDFLGKEVLGRLRKKNIAKAKAPETANAVKPTGEKKAAPADAGKKMTMKEFFGI